MRHFSSDRRWRRYRFMLAVVLGGGLLTTTLSAADDRPSGPKACFRLPTGTLRLRSGQAQSLEVVPFTKTVYQTTFGSPNPYQDSQIGPKAASTVPPSNPAAAIESSPLPQPHAFWDRNNAMLFSGVAIFRGLDYASTRNFQARGREEVLLPDDVVNNPAGFASLEAAGAMTSVGLSYWMHRTGHHKIERWISIMHISVAAFGVARNYALESKHRP